VLIDGIPVELPKEQNLPSWKSVENGTSEQPTIKPATETDVGK